MSMRKFTKTRLALAMALVWGGAQAAPLNLSNAPLYMGTAVPPNVLLLIDDSGSMDWEVVTRDADNDGRFTGKQWNSVTKTLVAAPTVHHNLNDAGAAECTFGNNGYFTGYFYGVEFQRNSYFSTPANNRTSTRHCSTADPQEWLFRNSNFNPLYYDPGKVYQRWGGVDKDGNDYQDMAVNAAKADPYLPVYGGGAFNKLTGSETISLTADGPLWKTGNTHFSSNRSGSGSDGFSYFTWADGNTNGLFDNGEQTEHAIRTKSGDDQKNFANWFSYHRSRMLTAKYAFGQLIANSHGLRMGLATLNNNNSNNVPIKDMNDDPKTGNKRALLDKLYSIVPGSSTPLRARLNEVGKYFSNQANSMGFTDNPILPQASGGACQQNFTIAMTDGYYNDSFSAVGNTDIDGAGKWDGGAYADAWSNTLADIAMRYYETDLSAALPNQVLGTPGIDDATHQHMVTYTVAFGVNGTLTAGPLNTTDAFPWPNPGPTTLAGDLAKVDDLRHAAFNGRGKFLNASDPTKLLDSLNDAITDIYDRTSSASAVAMNTTTLQNGSILYQAQFDASNWSGKLRYMQIDGGLALTQVLEVSTVLGGQAPDDRVILTSNAGAGVPFRWASLSAAQQAALNTNISGGVDALGEDRLKFLRGDRSKEGGAFRTRGSVLGDMIYSTPAYVGVPPFPYTANNYILFRNAHKTRTPIVYVGANDGMLHGFHADTGTELLAYVPNEVYGKLSHLSAAAYSHRYFVDGSPTVGDAYLGAAWKTVLVGTLRGGGQGVFALNVTDPANFSEGNASNIAMWEFTDTNDADLGYTYGQASIVKMANGKWAAVFGNGYNNTEADGAASTTGNAVLYIVDLETGALIRKISTGKGMSADPDAQNRPNGLAAPAAADVNNDGFIDYVYAGDLFGNLWRFDVTSANPASWGVSWGVPLFTAKSTAGQTQSISAQPTVGRHPSGTGYMVFFGTGKYLETSDSVMAIPNQTFYGIWDKNQATLTAFTRAKLLQQSITSEQINTAAQWRTVSTNAINWGSHLGWYMDLLNTQGGNTNNYGERAVTDPVLRGGRILFTTLIPNAAICTFGGSGWLMELDSADGSAPDEPAFDVNGDGRIDYIDKTALGGENAAGTRSVDGNGIPSKPVVRESAGPTVGIGTGSSGGGGSTTSSGGSTSGGTTGGSTSGSTSSSGGSTSSSGGSTSGSTGGSTSGGTTTPPEGTYKLINKSDSTIETIMNKIDYGTPGKMWRQIK